jgi:hypothetical protein
MNGRLVKQCEVNSIQGAMIEPSQNETAEKVPLVRCEKRILKNLNT